MGWIAMKVLPTYHHCYPQPHHLRQVAATTTETQKQNNSNFQVLQDGMKINKKTINQLQKNSSAIKKSRTNYYTVFLQSNGLTELVKKTRVFIQTT